MTHFFISYSHDDEPWAEWIAWALEKAGYTTKIQAWDFRAGSNFVVSMQEATAGCERTIAVLSPKYVESKFATPEWAAAFAKDPTGEKGLLVPVRIEKVELEGLLPQIVYIDLVGLGEAAAKVKLLERVKKGRRKPTTPPTFPGTPHPAFPGPKAGNGKAGEGHSSAMDASAVVPTPDEIPPRASLPSGSRMPFAPNPLFVGREDALRTLARHLEAGATAAIGEVKLAAASGMGGIGKTQLAVELVHRYGQFFEGGVFWLSFADPAAVPSEVAACGRALQLHPAWDSFTLADQTRLVQEAWTLPVPRLLVFDNCEEEKLLTEWRPTTGGARVLITSRRDRWSRSLGVEALPLPTFPRAKSVELLRRFRPDLRGDDPDLAEIAEELGDLPLALHLAGSYLAEYEYAPFGQASAYLEALRKGSLLDHSSLQGSDAESSPTGHELDVGRTFALSLDRLSTEDETEALARALLARAAFFAPGEPIPRELLLLTLEHGGSDEEVGWAERALLHLTSLGLLEIRSGGAVAIHRLVAAFATSLSERKGAEGVVRVSLLNEANRLNRSGVPGPLLAWQAHLRFVTEASQGTGDEVAGGLCNTLGFHLQLTGDLPGARPYYERALEIRETVLGPDHPDTATSLNNLGGLHENDGELGVARACYERSLAIREKVLGPEDPATARSLNNLGVLHWMEGDLAGARPFYERALAIWEKVLGLEHPSTAFSLNNLGILNQAEGDLAAARLYYTRALAVCESMRGPEHPETAACLSNLGSLHQAEGDLAGARRYYERSLAIVERTLGPEHPDTARSLNNLGFLHRAEGDLAGARPHYERSLAIREKILGPEHPDTRIVRGNLESLEELAPEVARTAKEASTEDRTG